MGIPEMGLLCTIHEKTHTTLFPGYRDHTKFGHVFLPVEIPTFGRLWAVSAYSGSYHIWSCFFPLVGNSNVNILCGRMCTLLRRGHYFPSGRRFLVFQISAVTHHEHKWTLLPHTCTHRRTHTIFALGPTLGDHCSFALLVSLCMFFHVVLLVLCVGCFHAIRNTQFMWNTIQPLGVAILSILILCSRYCSAIFVWNFFMVEYFYIAFHVCEHDPSTILWCCQATPKQTLFLKAFSFHPRLFSLTLPLAIRVQNFGSWTGHLKSPFTQCTQLEQFQQYSKRIITVKHFENLCLLWGRTFITREKKRNLFVKAIPHNV